MLTHSTSAVLGAYSAFYGNGYFTQQLIVYCCLLRNIQGVFHSFGTISRTYFLFLIFSLLVLYWWNCSRNGPSRRWNITLWYLWTLL